MARTPTDRIPQQGKATVTNGQWTGDVQSFVDWCAKTADLEAFRTALAAVPPHDPWAAVSRSLRAGIDYRKPQSETAPRTGAPEIFRAAESDGAELHEAKRKV